MGYEIKLHIGTLSKVNTQKYSKFEEKWLAAYLDKDTKKYNGYLNGEDKVRLNDPTHEAVYLMEVASLDICKPGHKSNINKLMQARTGEPAYIYCTSVHNGDVVDCYGDFLLAYPIKYVLYALEDDLKNSDYRRFKVAVDLLKSISANFKDAHVVLYGH